jgi:NADH-quinone oxidoreductase subunit J
MTLTFILLAALTLAGAIAALSLRNLVHCALSLVIAFAGLAGLYCLLGAQFVGLAQVLVYVGAVAILIVFAILLTREGGNLPERPASRAWLPGVAMAVLIFAVLAAVLGSSNQPGASAAIAGADAFTVKQIGDKLMTEFVLPLEVIALVLTAATIGAVIIALREEDR